MLRKTMQVLPGLFAVFAMSLSLVGVASAQNSLTSNDLGLGNDQTGQDISNTLGLPRRDLRLTIANIIKVAMSLLGIVAVVIILIGGFTWMTAGGNTEKVDEAKKWIFSGIIGLAIIVSAYAIATFVINNLISAATGTNPPPITG